MNLNECPDAKIFKILKYPHFITFQPLNAGQQNFVILKKKDQIPFSDNLTANGPLGDVADSAMLRLGTLV